MTAEDEHRVVLDRRTTPRGELVLRRSGEAFEIIANGTYLMDTRDGRSERLLVSEALADRSDARLLLGGLGAGFSLDEALRAGRAREVVVVEIEPAVIEWSRTHLRGLVRCGVDHPSVRLVIGDLVDALDSLDGGFDAICLDVDNGPGWLVHKRNAALYDEEGLRRLAALLLPGGSLAVWASAPYAAFEERLGRTFGEVRVVSVPVRRGPDDLIYL